MITPENVRTLLAEGGPRTRPGSRRRGPTPRGRKGDLVESRKPGAHSCVVKPPAFPEFSRGAAAPGFYRTILDRFPADAGRSGTG